jgi:hypothetical protein
MKNIIKCPLCKKEVYSYKTALGSEVLVETSSITKKNINSKYYDSITMAAHAPRCRG